MRGFAAVVAGLIVGVVAMMAVGYVGGLLFPIESRIDNYNAEQVRSAFSGASMGAQMAVVISWFLGTLAGAAVAKLIARRNWAAWTVAVIFTLYVVASLFILPMPTWMKLLSVVLTLVAGSIASRFGRTETVVAEERVEADGEA